MIECGTKQRAAPQSPRELSRKLLHPSDRGHLRHVFTQHFEVFQQQRSFVFQRGLERFAAMQRVFDLTKDPRVGHRAAADQNSIASGFAKAIERLLNRVHIAAAGNGNADDFLDLFHQVPVRQPAITLLFRAAVQRDVLEAAVYS